MKKEFKDLIVTVHMGGSGKYTQNSVAAFHDCWMNHVWGEGDVRVTKDKELVIIHDRSTKSVCKGAPDLIVKEQMLEDLQKLDLCTGDGLKYKIPVLKDLFKQMKTCEGRNILLDVKDDEAFPILRRLVKEYEVEKQVHLFHDDFDKCITIKKAFPRAKIFHIVRDVKKIKAEWFQKDEISGFVYCAAEGKIDSVIEDVIGAGLDKHCKLAQENKKRFGVVVLKPYTEKMLKEHIKAGFDIFGIENIEKFKTMYNKV